ncbi:MAG TPA: hypothetical protein VII01_10625 [Solirubrobacteraceae bacterium]
MTMRASSALLLAAAALLAPSPAGAAASAVDVSAGAEYLRANYELVKNARRLLRPGEQAPLRVLAQVRRDCPMAAAGSPQNSQSTQLSNEVIGAMVLSAYDLDVPALQRFVGTVRRLRFSDSSLARAVRSYAAKIETLAVLAPPNLCADIGAWAAGGFHTLPSSTVRFVGRFMPAWVALGLLPARLARYENGESRALAHRCDSLEVQLTDGEARAVESWGKIMNELVLNP